MDNLRLTVFDVFSYILPGVCMLVSVLWGINRITISDLSNLIANMNINIILFYIFVSYLLGFVVDAFSIVSIYKITDKILGKFSNRIIKEHNNKNSDNLIDEYHFSKIYSFSEIKHKDAREKADQFLAMSGLARNLCFTFIITVLVIIIKNMLAFSYINWLNMIGQLVSFFALSYLLMIRADIFRRWAHSHLLDIYVLEKHLKKE